MFKISIKQISLNSAYRGRRFATPKLKQYKLDMSAMLPKIVNVDFTKIMCLEIRFGVSSKLADIDNPVKAFMDAVATQYGFNDNMIYRLTVEKEIVKKKQEYVAFKLFNITKI